MWSLKLKRMALLGDSSDYWINGHNLTTGQLCDWKRSLYFLFVLFVKVSGRKVRGRQYPWGFVEVDNPQHSDFALLRKFLIQTHMQDLKDVTHDVHYENFR